MSELITPEQIPQWIPGCLTRDSSPLAWEGITLKGYSYTDLEVVIPTMRDFMIVVYRRGTAEMSRRSGGPWHSEKVEPGIVSILTRAEQSQWRWSKPIDVSHLYLSQAAIAQVAGEVFDRDIQDVEMCDMVRAEDPILTTLMATLEHELNEGGLGGHLYVEALKNQLCIHILRRYAKTSFREHRSYGRLSPAQCRLLTHYVEAHIGQNISLAELAGVTQLGVFSFIRKFQAEFGYTPHSYVMTQRLEHAKRLLTRQDIPLKVVAARSGFADQSHMTRFFRRILNVTPSEYRHSISTL
jgi:AraC family transcriptional regulator